MSAALGVADGFGVMNRQPPRLIVQALLPGLGKEETNAMAVLSHIGYGTAAGAAYMLALAPEHRNTGTGMLYGVAVWAVGYEGWLPLLGILPPAHRDKPGRAWTMFIAHLVYGATLGRSAGRRSRATAGKATNAAFKNRAAASMATKRQHDRVEAL